MAVTAQRIEVSKKEAQIIEHLDMTEVSDISVLARTLKINRDTVRYTLYTLAEIGLAAKKNNGYIRTTIPYRISSRQNYSRKKTSINPHVPYWKYIESIPKSTFDFVRDNIKETRATLLEKTKLSRLQLNFVIMYCQDFGKK